MSKASFSVPTLYEASIKWPIRPRDVHHLHGIRTQSVISSVNGTQLRDALKSLFDLPDDKTHLSHD